MKDSMVNQVLSMGEYQWEGWGINRVKEGKYGGLVLYL
jgi:hypothetical protein